MTKEDERFLEELEKELKEGGYIISDEEAELIDYERLFDETYFVPWRREDIQVNKGQIKVYRKISIKVNTKITKKGNINFTNLGNKIITQNC